MKPPSKISLRMLSIFGILSVALSLLCFYYILALQNGTGGIEAFSKIDTLGNLSCSALKAGVFAAVVCDVFAGNKKKHR